MKTNFTLPQAAITMGFNSLSGPAFASISGGIADAMTDNAYYVNPDPVITVIQQQLSDYLISASVAQNRDRDAVQTKLVTRQLLTGSLKTLGKYVTLIADGDRQMLISSGFVLNKRGDVVPPLARPENIQVTDGLNPGSAFVSVNSVKQAKSYLYQFTMDPITEKSVWTTESGTGKSFTFTNLQRNLRYWFRIAAVGSRGQLVYSDVISRIVQ